MHQLAKVTRRKEPKTAAKTHDFAMSLWLRHVGDHSARTRTMIVRKHGLLRTLRETASEKFWLPRRRSNRNPVSVKPSCTDNITASEFWNGSISSNTVGHLSRRTGSQLLDTRCSREVEWGISHDVLDRCYSEKWEQGPDEEDRETIVVLIIHRSVWHRRESNSCHHLNSH